MKQKEAKAAKTIKRGFPLPFLLRPLRFLGCLLFACTHACMNVLILHMLHNARGKVSPQVLADKWFMTSAWAEKSSRMHACRVSGLLARSGQPVFGLLRFFAAFCSPSLIHACACLFCIFCITLAAQ